MHSACQPAGPRFAPDRSRAAQAGPARRSSRWQGNLPSMTQGSQLERLRAGVDALLESNRFYQARLHPVRTWDDFERLPLTTKDEITADEQGNPPFGTNLTFPIDHYSRLHQTSGTSG